MSQESNQPPSKLPITIPAHLGMLIYGAPIVFLLVLISDREKTILEQSPLVLLFTLIMFAVLIFVRNRISNLAKTIRYEATAINYLKLAVMGPFFKSINLEQNRIEK